MNISALAVAPLLHALDVCCGSVEGCGNWAWTIAALRERAGCNGCSYASSLPHFDWEAGADVQFQKMRRLLLGQQCLQNIAAALSAVLITLSMQQHIAVAPGLYPLAGGSASTQRPESRSTPRLAPLLGCRLQSAHSRDAHLHAAQGCRDGLRFGDRPQQGCVPGRDALLPRQQLHCLNDTTSHAF